MLGACEPSDTDESAARAGGDDQADDDDTREQVDQIDDLRAECSDENWRSCDDLFDLLTETNSSDLDLAEWAGACGGRFDEAPEFYCEEIADYFRTRSFAPVEQTGVVLQCPPHDEGPWDWYHASFGYIVDAPSNFVSYAIDYGDGHRYSTASWEDAQQNLFWHRYESPGFFEVTFTATRSDGSAEQAQCDFSWTSTGYDNRVGPTQSGVRVGAICNDGTHSDATGQGACSWHDGVDYWLYS